ncbi:MAG TPA: hypothetical protein VE914_13995 [Candidatus Angelobacter sp.]|nr:hypothetical protein [Candidatus Angelobacter sp.]
MPKFRISVSAKWRDQYKKPASGNSLISAVNPGDSASGWQSEKVLSVDQLKKLFEVDANKAKKVTFLMELHYATMLFPKGRDIDYVSLEFKDWQSGNVIVVENCKDLTVIKNMPSDDNQRAVTFDFDGKFAT